MKHVALMLLAAATALPAWAGGSATLQVSAVVLSRSNCFFNPPRAGILDFGDLDPRNTADASAVTSSLTFKCAGTAPVAFYTVSHDTGLNGDASGNRMKHETANEYLPYSISLSPASGSVARNADVTVTVSGTVRAADYRSASVGRYFDTVTLTVNP